MTRVRRARGEPAWPLVLIVAFVGVGLGFGALFMGGSDPGPREDPEMTADSPGLPTPEQRIRVEVLNAGGVQGAAGDARDYLRGEGFDVVYVGNAPQFGDGPTVVLDRTGRSDAAREVARSLGAPEVREAVDPNLLVDVTVLVGTDWVIGQIPTVGATSNLAEGVEANDGARAWWDIRRFFDGEG